MRITSAHAFESSVANLQRRQQSLSDLQERMTSGKRVLRAGDDPTAAANAERALAVESRSSAQLRSLGASRNAMTLAESALGDASELLHRARELMVGAGNGSYSDKERVGQAQALRGLRDDLLMVANRSDGSGRYLFGGQGSDSPPLVDAIGGVIYVGATGELRAAGGEATPLALDGRAAWLQAPDAAMPGTTISVFDALDRAVGELQIGGRTSVAVALTVSQGLSDIDSLQANVSNWRTRAGESLNRGDGIENRLGQVKLDAQRQRSEAEDLDMVSAISEFQTRQSGYDAALKTYSLVQRMSLFDYLK